MQNLFFFKVSYKIALRQLFICLRLPPGSPPRLLSWGGQAIFRIAKLISNTTHLPTPPPPAHTFLRIYLVARGRGGVELNRWTHPSRDDNECIGLFFHLWPYVDRWNSYTGIQSRPSIAATLQLVSADTWTKPDTDPWESGLSRTVWLIFDVVY